MSETAEHAGFLEAILADPADDALRLIYADWLDDHGQPERAEFIRCQIELASLPDHVLMAHSLFGHLNKRLEVLRKRQQELLDNGRWRDFASPAIEVIPDGALYTDHLTLSRGFVEALTCTADDWLTHADAITAATPLREVTLTTLPVVERNGELFSRRKARLASRETWHDWKTLVHDTSQPYPTERALLKAEWPGISFTLPPSISAEWDTRPRNIRDDLQALRERYMREPVARPPQPTLPDAVLEDARQQGFIRREVTDSPEPSQHFLNPAPFADRTHGQAICQCEMRPVVRLRDLPATAVFHPIDLHSADWTDGRTRTRYWFGQCRQCWAVYWSMRELPDYGPSPTLPARAPFASVMPR